MNTDDIKKHWDTIYQTKSPNEVSWTQEIPKTSLDVIRSTNVPRNARILDVGGGDSTLVDYLLAEEFNNITVLDISERALERAQKRLGPGSNLITWITGDITAYQPEQPFDLWHDRAVFHFLTTDDDITAYVSLASKAIVPGGILVIATFSTDGPTKCSGLGIRQYNEETLTQQFASDFEKIKCFTEDHVTPMGAKQNFLFGLYRRNQD